ncbi:MAG: HNH endonuclease [Agriterribacter sp.]
MTNIYNRPAPLDGNKKVTISQLEYNALIRNQKQLPEKYLHKKRFTTIKGEEWKLIPGTTNFEISNQGRVRKCYRDKYGTYFVSVLTPKSTVNGFYKKRLNLGEGVIKEIYLHKVVAELFVPRAEFMSGWIAYHIDGNTLNNRASNLAWRPRKIADSHSGKLKEIPYVSRVDGSVKIKRAKLSAGDRQEIIRFINSKTLTQSQIAERFGITQAWVSRIKNTGLRFVGGYAVPYSRTPNDN